MICGFCEYNEYCKCIDCELNSDCGQSCATCKREGENYDENKE